MVIKSSLREEALYFLSLYNGRRRNRKTHFQVRKWRLRGHICIYFKCKGNSKFLWVEALQYGDK